MIVVSSTIFYFFPIAVMFTRINSKELIIHTYFSATDKHQMVYDENSGKVSLMIKSIGPGDEGKTRYFVNQICRRIGSH